ncbi:MAG: MFS transporter [Deltaproteobacteria bacterium]|jgi:MFS family permease|nr:MFS transporter [Deltaproteobacteria bacterium]
MNEPVLENISNEKPTLWTGAFVTFLFINLCIFMGFNMLLPTLSLYLAGNGCSEHEIGIIFGSFTISAIAARLLASPMSQRFGALWVARAGLFICAIGTLFYFLYENIPSYLAARLMQGAGFGLTSTLLVSLAAQSMPISRLAEGMGYLGLGATVSLALGPYAGIFLAETLGFKVMFIAVSLSYLAATLVSLLLPKIVLPLQEQAGLDEERRFHLEKRAIPPAILMLIYGCGVSAIIAYLAIYASQEHLPSAAVFFMVSTVGTIASRLWAGRIYDQYGHKYVIPPALLCSVIAVIAIISKPSAPIMFTAAVFYGLGAGAMFPSMQTLALTAVPMEKRTISSAYFFVAFDLGTGVGAVFMGFMARSFHTYRVCFIMAVIFFVILFVTYLYLFKTDKGSLPPPKSPTPSEA